MEQNNEAYEISQRMSRIIFLLKELNDFEEIDHVQFDIFKDKGIYMKYKDEYLMFTFESLEPVRSETGAIIQQLNTQYHIREFLEKSISRYVEDKNEDSEECVN